MGRGNILIVVALLALAACQESPTEPEAPKADATKVGSYVDALPDPALETLSQAGCDKTQPEQKPPTTRQSTYDRVRHGLGRDTSPVDLTAVYDAYRCGRMAQRDAAAYEYGVRTGSVVLGRGQRLRPVPSAPLVPDDVVAAYNSGQLSERDRAKVRSALEAGLSSLPLGAALNP